MKSTPLSSLFLFVTILLSLVQSSYSTRDKKAGTKTTTQLLRDPRSYLHNHLTHSRDFKKELDELSKEESYFWTRELSSQSFSSSLSYSYDDKHVMVMIASKNTTDCPKTSWPECVSEPLTCEGCKTLITDENHPEITMIDIVPYDAFVTADYRLDRVRIFCNGTTVTTEPMVG
jgi:predicted glutamine amidotransferase